MLGFLKRKDPNQMTENEIDKVIFQVLHDGFTEIHVNNKLEFYKYIKLFDIGIAFIKENGPHLKVETNIYICIGNFPAKKSKESKDISYAGKFTFEEGFTHSLNSEHSLFKEKQKVIYRTHLKLRILYEDFRETILKGYASNTTSLTQKELDELNVTITSCLGDLLDGKEKDYYQNDFLNLLLLPYIEDNGSLVKFVEIIDTKNRFSNSEEAKKSVVYRGVIMGSDNYFYTIKSDLLNEYNLRKIYIIHLMCKEYYRLQNVSDKS